MQNIQLWNFKKNFPFKTTKLMGQNTDLLFVSCVESRIESPRSLYGCFDLGPFTSNQSVTIANTIRRTLLSELKGLAITSVEIEGATHEYSTLPGVRDSLLNILLNLKDVVLKSQFSFKKPQFSYVQVIGPGVIRAKDLKLPAFIQCVDPNQYIATLAENGILNMKLQIEEGKNYRIQTPIHLKNGLNQRFKKILSKKFSNVKKETNQAFGTRVNFTKSLTSSLFEQKKLVNKTSYPLLIDAVFMPIQKVNYTMELDEEISNYRYLTLKNPYNREYLKRKNEHLTTITKNNFLVNQKIILEIWTNGSIHPRQALSYSLKEVISIFVKLESTKIFNSMAFEALLNHSNFKISNIYSNIFKSDKVKSRSYMLNTLNMLNRVKSDKINSDKVKSDEVKRNFFFRPEYFKEMKYLEVLEKINEKSTNTSLTNLSNKQLSNLESKNKKPIKKNFKNQIDKVFTKKNKNQIDLKDIGNLNISLRSYTCLKQANINTIDELINKSKKELLELNNFGKKSLFEVEKSLQELGLQLKNEIPG